MSVTRVLALGVFGALVTAPLAAQGIPRRAAINPGRAAAPTQRMLVANPYPSSSADSVLAVRIGSGLRTRLDKLGGNDINVLADTTMNRALKEFGYPADALLSPLLARQLALNLASRLVVTSTLSRGEAGNRVLTARLAGANDDAGQVVQAPMQPNQDPVAFGNSVGEQFGPVLKALPDARTCVETREKDPKKAREAAEKALKTVPNYGLAEYCLARIAMDQKAPQQQIVQHLQNATKGDPLSLPAWSQLAAQYEQAHDTAQVLAAYQQILRVAPGDAKLRETIFRYFLQTGKPELAKNVADEGLKLDPFNADMYDLKSNACLFLSDFTCAVQALEQAYTVDSTRADTLFFAKIQVAAEQRLADTMPKPTAQDTATFVKWAKTGAQKFPNNLTLLNALNRAYAYTGQVDSTLAVSRRILTLDSTSVGPAIATVTALVGANRLAEAQPFIQRVEQKGDQNDKERLAVVFLNAARPKLQQPTQDFKAAADLSRQAVALSDPNGRLYPQANLLLGYGALFQAATGDEQVAKSKSCQGARTEQQLIDEAEKAFTIAKAANPDAAAKQLETIGKFKPRAAALVKAFCR
ncbi:MAG TPA: hypothetical protein VFS40_02710 [Gemmatimonadales bacterium]|nr:hypothetical protein [Gemmatimonadales bacterium]